MEAYDSLGQVYGVMHAPLYPSAAPWLKEAFGELRALAKTKTIDFDVSETTIEHARRLLKSFPAKAPKPDLSVDPDGQLALDWQLAPRWVLTATVAEDSMVYFAGLFGANRYRGAEHFDCLLPKGLAASLERFVDGTIAQEPFASN